MRRRTRHRVVLAWIITATALACRTAGSRGPDHPTSATLQVENHGFADARIYALHVGERLRLGLAAGHATTMLPIPARLLQGAFPLRFVVDPIAGTPEPPTDEIAVFPGDTVVLVIEGS